MGFQIRLVVEDQVAGERKDPAGGDGDEGLDEEDFFVLAQVEIDAWDFL